MKRTYWIIFFVVLTLTACGGQTPPGAAILPLEELPGGLEGPNVLDDTGTSVVIQFTSGVPTVCNVAYGTDTNYGSLATMPMMGGAVREHAVTLTGLTPNTTYHYRITLTDEQARVYQSQDFTFTTGAAPSEGEVDQPKGENVASLAAGARVVGVSSNWGGGANDSAFGADNAIDGQPNTEWSSNGDGDDAWIEIELAQTYEVHTIGFWTRIMSDGTAQIFRFTVTTDRGETFGPFDLPDTTRIYTFPVQFAARTLRFDAVETSNGNTGAVEIEVYGTPHEPYGQRHTNDESHWYHTPTTAYSMPGRTADAAARRGAGGAWSAGPSSAGRGGRHRQGTLPGGVRGRTGRIRLSGQLTLPRPRPPGPAGFPGC